MLLTEKIRFAADGEGGVGSSQGAGVDSSGCGSGRADKRRSDRAANRQGCHHAASGVGGGEGAGGAAVEIVIGGWSAACRQTSRPPLGSLSRRPWRPRKGLAFLSIAHPGLMHVAAARLSMVRSSLSPPLCCNTGSIRFSAPVRVMPARLEL